MADYKITIDLKNVGEGDGEVLADGIWNNSAEGYEANQGSFSIKVSKDGVDVNYDPPTEDSPDI